MACASCNIKDTAIEVGHFVLVAMIAFVIIAMLKKHTFLGDWI